MSDEDIQLIDPTEEMPDAYIDYLDEFLAAGESEFDSGGDLARADFPAFIGRLRDWAEGIGLLPGWVPSRTYWLVRGGRILGTCSLRYQLTDGLMDFGGHIGYGIRPSERNRGYGTRMLAMVLEIARRNGLKRVRITCAKANPASARVIQKNGGVLESETFSHQAGRITRRYWIEL